MNTKSYLTLKDFLMLVTQDETTLKLLQVLIQQEKDKAWHEGYAAALDC